MTRINCGVHPSELINSHLIAEHREIKRIPNTIKSGKAVIKDLPSKFTLGTGHVKFFYNKIAYLRNRYQQIYNECKKRNINVEYYGNAFDDIPNHLDKDYNPTLNDSIIVLERIASNIYKAYCKKQNT